MTQKQFAKLFILFGAVSITYFIVPGTGRSQDWFSTGINLGAPRIRLAVSEFQPQSVSQELVRLTQEFNETLRNDLDQSGIFDLVSKSMVPLKAPVEPPDVDFKAWSSPPAEAQMLVFGKTEVINSNLVITGRLFDVRNTSSPSVFGKRYVATMNEISTRDAAHRLANEIIKALGGGVPGIAETRIAFVSNRTGHLEIWLMDYDGFNQRPITSYGSIALTPRWSPDNTRLAYTSYSVGNPDIFMFSLETNRRIPFPAYRGLNTTPAWAPDGNRFAFCSSMSGDPEIYVSDTNGQNLHRLTVSPGVDISPVWNPKTGNEIAF
ncbi:MAG: translocation protein TolB, partial [Deltaproteobacteria bacterium]